MRPCVRSDPSREEVTTMTRLATLLSAVAAIGLWPAAHASTASCASVTALRLANVRVTSAIDVAAGAFVPPGGNATEAYTRLPAFCRVAATLTPTADSDITIEVWLPASGWNG